VTTGGDDAVEWRVSACVTIADDAEVLSHTVVSVEAGSCRRATCTMQR
jgi:hypothetical protein